MWSASGSRSKHTFVVSHRCCNLAQMSDRLVVRGAREHNLQNVSIDLPREKLIVFTGLSGSGKSSLAFDTIYAEGQRRYVESLSAYARQFLGQMDRGAACCRRSCAARRANTKACSTTSPGRVSRVLRSTEPSSTCRSEPTSSWTATRTTRSKWWSTG